MKTPIIDSNSSYSFTDYFKLSLSAALWWQNHQKATQHLLVGQARDAAQEWDEFFSDGFNKPSISS